MMRFKSLEKLELAIEEMGFKGWKIKAAGDIMENAKWVKGTKLKGCLELLKKLKKKH